jgi:hypothetical protein
VILGVVSNIASVNPARSRCLSRPRATSAGRAGGGLCRSRRYVRVNFLIAPIDGVLTEITNDALQLLNPTHAIGLTANFYFAVVSSLVLIVVCTLVTERSSSRGSANIAKKCPPKDQLGKFVRVPCEHSAVSTTIFQLESARRLRGRRSARSHYREFMGWKT